MALLNNAGIPYLCMFQFFKNSDKHDTARLSLVVIKDRETCVFEWESGVYNEELTDKAALTSSTSVLSIQLLLFSYQLSKQ